MTPKVAEGEQEIDGYKRLPKSLRDCDTLLETDNASYQLRNDLFTACKTGDLELLHCLLKEEVGNVSGTPTPQATSATILDLPEGPGSLSPPDNVSTPNGKGSNKNSDQTSCKPEQAFSDHQDRPKNPIYERQHNKEAVSEYAPPASALVNERIDSGGFTLLHVAAAAGQNNILSLLMDTGWDPAVRDDLGQTPYSVSADKQTRNAFRKYSAEYPSKYNYIKAQIPPPLTAELEAKKEEKKRAQKMVKKQREKAEKEEKKQKEQEEEEKKRFAALSDREKRALAAEKRFSAQMATSGMSITNTRGVG